MKNWRPLPSKGGLIGITFTLIAAALLLAAMWATWLSANATQIVDAVQGEAPTPDTPPEQVIISTGTNLGTFGLGLLCFALLAVVLYLAYQTRRYFALSYSLDRNSITIDLGDSKQVIPLANIRQVVAAQSVLNQMRARVFETEPGASPKKTGPSNVAYPRNRAVAVEPGPALEADSPEANTGLAEDEANPSYMLTSTAAADSSLDHLEKIRVEVVEAGQPPAPFDPAGVEVEEGQVVELEPDEIKSVAVDFSEQPHRAGSGSNAVAGGPGSVNFSVRRRPFSSWPGFYVNAAQVASLGRVQFYSTQPFTKNLLVRTERRTYAISPRDQQQFITEFNLRRRLGAIDPVQEGIVKGAFLSHPLWHDRLGRGLILAGVILNLLLYLWLLWAFESLPGILQIHFNKLGQVDRTGERGELMVLPFIGLLAVLGNCLIGAYLHPKERIPAYLLYAAAVLVQVLTAIAVFIILLVS